jgi:tRNA pseudouridine38-40 synthase
MFFYEVTATAYLHHMVRRLVGSQIAVARGLISLEQFESVLKSCHLANNKWMAPAQGLTLTEVTYPPAGMSRDTYLQSKD